MLATTGPAEAGLERPTPSLKITLNIDGSLMQRLREEAVRRGTTMSALVEPGLRNVLGAQASSENQPGDLPPLPSWHGGKELDDIANRKELFGAIEEHRGVAPFHEYFHP